MKIVFMAVLMLSPLARAQTTEPAEHKGAPATTAAVPNDNAKNDVSQTTAQPSGQVDDTGVASNPNVGNSSASEAKSPQPQPNSTELRAKPMHKAQGKTRHSKMHQTRTDADAPAASSNTDLDAAKKPTDTKDTNSGNLTPSEKSDTTGSIARPAAPNTGADMPPSAEPNKPTDTQKPIDTTPTSPDKEK